MLPFTSDNALKQIKEIKCSPIVSRGGVLYSAINDNKTVTVISEDKADNKILRIWNYNLDESNNTAHQMAHFR